MTDDFKRIKLSYDPAQITVLKSVLGSEDIPYLLQGEHFLSLYPSTPFLGGSYLRVRQEDADRVQEILDKLAEKIEPLDEDWEDDMSWEGEEEGDS